VFRKKNDKKPLKYPTATSFWDQGKVESIAKGTWFEVNLTSFIDSRGFGRSSSYNPLEDEQEAHGFADWPASLVAITFSDEPIREHAPPKPPTIGMWMYELWGNEKEGYLGRLLFTFFDQDRSIRTTLKQAHAASLVSGWSTTSLVIRKEEGVGDFTAKDREHGYSYESRFPFCGLSVEERYQSLRLKKWAVPYLDEDFSGDDAPF
jgi:hypothetical protein